MAIVYLDSSVLVSIALRDARGSQALAILGPRDAYASELSQVECQSGLSFQYASAPSGLPAAEQALNAVLARVQMIQITAAILAQARTLVRRHRAGLGLRTLHARASCVLYRNPGTARRGRHRIHHCRSAATQRFHSRRIFWNLAPIMKAAARWSGSLRSAR